MDARNWMRFKDVEGAISGTYDILDFVIIVQVWVGMETVVDVLGSLTFSSKADGFFRWEVYHYKAIGASLSRILNGVFFAISEHGIVITCRSQH